MRDAAEALSFYRTFGNNAPLPSYVAVERLPAKIRKENKKRS
jgi:hypothetical protein